MINISKLCFLFYIFLISNLVSAATVPSAEHMTLDYLTIDESAATTKQAKLLGLLHSKQTAYRLLAHLFVDNFHDYISIPDKKINRAISSIVIRDERITPQHYSALVQYTFDLEEFVKTIHLHHNARILIIPILYRDHKMSLWENKWYEAWSKINIPKLSILSEDLLEIHEIYKFFNTTAPYLQQIEFFKKLANKYSVDEVVIITADYKKNDIEVTIERPYYLTSKKITYNLLQNTFNTIVTTLLSEFTSDNAVGKYVFTHKISLVKERTDFYYLLIHLMENWQFLRKHVLDTTKYNICYVSSQWVVVRLPTSYTQDVLIDKVTAHNFTYEQVHNTFLIDNINQSIAQ